MKINATDGSWDIEIFPASPGSANAHEDNVFMRITEARPQGAGMLRASQITIRIPSSDARKLAGLLIGACPESKNEGRTSPAQKNSAGLFTEKQGRYLSFIHHYQQKYLHSPAESDIQRRFLVSAPTVNSMMQRLQRLGLIARTPGQARSIRLLVPIELLTPFD